MEEKGEKGRKREEGRKMGKERRKAMRKVEKGRARNGE